MLLVLQPKIRDFIHIASSKHEMYISAYLAFSRQFIMRFFCHKNHVAEQWEPKLYVLFEGINNQSGFFNHMGNLYHVLNKPSQKEQTRNFWIHNSRDTQLGSSLDSSHHYHSMYLHLSSNTPPTLIFSNSQNWKELDASPSYAIDSWGDQYHLSCSQALKTGIILLCICRILLSW